MPWILGKQQGDHNGRTEEAGEGFEKEKPLSGWAKPRPCALVPVREWSRVPAEMLPSRVKGAPRKCVALGQQGPDVH